MLPFNKCMVEVIVTVSPFHSRESDEKVNLCNEKFYKFCSSFNAGIISYKM